MPDFNKGDFTQQGVNGHVNATVRLNEKRLVSIDLTSNEEAEGCTITGTVKDLLNDKVYGIGSGVSGNIEITENGENINVAPYATATVNVSGGGGLDIKYCEITFLNEGEYAADRNVCIGEDGLLLASGTLTNGYVAITPYKAGHGNEVNICYENPLTYPTEAEALASVVDPVNLTVAVEEDFGEYFTIITVTDPTQNSSCSMHLPIDDNPQ